MLCAPSLLPLPASAEDSGPYALPSLPPLGGSANQPEDDGTLEVPAQLSAVGILPSPIYTEEEDEAPEKTLEALVGRADDEPPPAAPPATTEQPPAPVTRVVESPPIIIKKEIIHLTPDANAEASAEGLQDLFPSAGPDTQPAAPTATPLIPLPPVPTLAEVKKQEEQKSASDITAADVQPVVKAASEAPPPPPSALPPPPPLAAAAPSSTPPPPPPPLPMAQDAAPPATAATAAVPQTTPLLPLPETVTAATAASTPAPPAEAAAATAAKPATEKKSKEKKSKTAKAKKKTEPTPLLEPATVAVGGTPPVDSTAAAAGSEPSPQLSSESQAIANKIPSNIGGKKPKGPPPLIAVDHAKAVPALDKETTSVKHEGMGIDIEVKRPALDPNYELQRAYDAGTSGHSDDAIEIYKNILANDSKNKSALFGLATLYHRAGQLEQARSYYGKLLQVDPQNRDGLNNFLVLLSDEAPEAAISQLEELEQRNPQFSPIPAQLAVVYAKTGNSEKAMEQMMRAIQLAPENLTYRYNLAIMLDKGKNYEEAGKLYHQLIEAYYRGEHIPGNIQKIQQRLTFISSNRP